jgi:hypothetical protein
MAETTQSRPQGSALIHEPPGGQHESGGTCDG